MTKPRIDPIEVVLSAQRREGEHSPLFLWLLEHHDAIVASLQGGRIGWGAFCAAIAEGGFTDATGKPPSENTARITWYRVRRLAARQRAAREAADDRGPEPRVLPRPPSKMSPAARPLQANRLPPPREAPSPTRDADTGTTLAGSEPPTRRPLKVFTSLEDIKPWQPTPDPNPASNPGASGVLPPPTWPKPVM